MNKHKECKPTVETLRKFPCKECISFALCNSRAYSLRFVFNISAIISHLHGNCTILQQAFRQVSVPPGCPRRLHPIGAQMINLFKLHRL